MNLVCAGCHLCEADVIHGVFLAIVEIDFQANPRTIGHGTILFPSYLHFAAAKPKVGSMSLLAN